MHNSTKLRGASRGEIAVMSGYLIKCPPKYRLVENVTAEVFEQLPNAIVVYGWDKLGRGLRESCRETRNAIRMKNLRGWRPQPDPLFDFLHTRFRNQWRLRLLRAPNGHPFLLKVVFRAEGHLDEFRASWDRGVCPLRATEIDNIIQWPIEDDQDRSRFCPTDGPC